MEDGFMDQRRQKLLDALRNAGAMPGGRGLGGRSASPLFGGHQGGRGYSDYPSAALPSLSFNPFLAQMQRGVPHLAAQTHGGAPDSAPPPRNSVGAAAPGQPSYTPPDSFYGQAQAEAAPAAAPQPAQAPAPYQAPQQAPAPYQIYDSGARSLLGVGSTPASTGGITAAGLAAQAAGMDQMRSAYITRLIRLGAGF